MNSKHLCYIDNSSINGVFDMFTVKKACLDTHSPSLKIVKFKDYVKNIRGMIKCEEPNSNLYTFSGKLKLENFPRASDITQENFILRGSLIKNVNCVYGMVIYTGMETKIMQVIRSKKKREIKNDRNIFYKTFKSIHYLLILIFVLFCLMFILSIINKKFYYVEFQKSMFINPQYDLLYGINEFIMTFQLIIPYTMYSMIIIAYYIMAMFIKWDINIRQKSKYTIDIINPKSISDFGNVKYILTDKTGTLTSRKFILKACSIKGKLYSLDSLDRNDNDIFIMKNYDIQNLELYQDLNSNSFNSDHIKQFFEFLSLCNSTKLKSKLKDNNNNKIFSFIFAEEKAMLREFEKFGYILLKKGENKVILEIKGDKKTFYILGDNSFSKSRKRMSVLIKKSKNERESYLICKGYDMSIINLLKKDNQIEISLIKDQIVKLSSYGFRYVIFCKKWLSEEDTTSFMTKYKLAENYALDRDFLYENLALEYEDNLELLGILFFEEKVSSDLRYSLAKLTNSGINVWVVSGDKKENVIGLANNLEMIKSNMNIVEFSENDDIDDLDIKMNLALNQLINKNFKESGIIKMYTRSGKGINVDRKHAKNQEICIIISGFCMNIICMDPRLYQFFSILLSFASSLFAYQFNINNKYQLCKILKKFVTLNSKVLAIGDGLNDYMMLKEADLSVGIYSKEILQLRDNCDVIVTKFSQIVELILVHGSWNLHRLINISFFSIYANMLIIFPIFVYQAQISIDSAFYYQNHLQLVLKLLVINMSILFINCFDQFIERPLLGINKMLYSKNFFSQNEYYLMFLKTFAKAIFESFVILYTILYSCSHNINIIGETIDINILAETIFFTSYIVIFLQLYIYCLSSINLVIISINIISITSILGVYLIDYNISISMYQGLSFLNVILASLLASSFCYLYYFVYKSFKFNFDPDFFQNLAKKFKNFIDENMIFLNFEDNIKSISNTINNVKANNKITYVEVIENLNKRNHTIDSAIDNLTDVNNEMISSLKIRKPSLIYIDEKLEKDYNLHFNKLLIDSFKAYQVSIFAFYIIDIIIEGSKGNLMNQIISKTLKLIAFLFSLCLYKKKNKEKFLSNFIIYYYFLLLIEIICIYIEINNNDIKIFLQMIVLFSYPLLIANRSFYWVTIGLILFYVIILPAMIYNDLGFKINDPNHFLLEQNLSLIYHRSLYIIIIFVMMIIFGYNEELDSRISFIKYNKKALDLKKDGEIFNNLVPEFIQGKMKNTFSRDFIEYEIVTIVFCDISDFDKLVAKLSPKDLITLLDKIYFTFDQLCTLHGIQKIETVGKTYLASGGLRECEKDIDNTLLSKHHAVRIFEMAIDMIDLMKRMTLENGEIVRIKIGVHTGKVIPAVVGNHKPQFSLIGDTVNTSARMCSYSKDLCIMCSEFAYEHISKVYNDFLLSEQIVKGKGKMKLALFDPIKNKLNIFKTKIENIRETQWLFKNITIRQQQILKTNNAFLNDGCKNKELNIIKQEKKLQPEKIIFKNNLESCSNRSVFIFENSIDMPERTDMNSEVKLSPDKTLVKKLSKRMTTINKENTLTNANTDEINYIFNDSFFFLSFKPIDEKLEGKRDSGNSVKNFPKEVYERYLKLKLEKNQGYTIIIHIVYVFCQLLGVYNFSSYTNFFSYIIIFNFMKMILIILLICTLVFSSSLREKLNLYKSIVSLIYLGFILVTHSELFFGNQYFYINLFLEQYLTILITCFNGVLNFKNIFIVIMTYIVIIAINLIIFINNYLIVKYSIVTIFTCFVIILFLIIREYISTMDYIMNKQKNDLLQSVEDLLFNLMPPHVLQNLKEDIPVADVLNNVTLLFADIVNFTDFSAEREPFEVVEMLKELFKRFDDTCKLTNCYKVHTIGDCYVVLSFTGKIPIHERNYVEEARNVIKMGEKMIQIIKEVRTLVNFEPLNMRIGIHTGTVIGGIIGTKVVRYDIFGSDVQIANKMESSGIAGRINISEDTKRILESDNNAINYNYETNKTISIPSLNREVVSYLIKEDEI